MPHFPASTIELQSTLLLACERADNFTLSVLAGENRVRTDCFDERQATASVDPDGAPKPEAPETDDE